MVSLHLALFITIVIIFLVKYSSFCFQVLVEKNMDIAIQFTQYFFYFFEQFAFPGSLKIHYSI